MTGIIFLIAAMFLILVFWALWLLSEMYTRHSIERAAREPTFFDIVEDLNVAFDDLKRQIANDFGPVIKQIATVADEIMKAMGDIRWR